MNRLLVALMAIYLACIQVNGLELKNLCDNSTFDYKQIEVNSFLQRRFNHTLQNVGYYAIDENDLDLYNWFQNQKDRDDFQKTVDNYNEYLIDLYSEAFMNSEKLNDIHLQKDKVVALKKQIDIAAGKANENKRNTISYVVQNCDRLGQLIDQVQLYKSNTLNSYLWSFDDFKYFMDNLEIKKGVETFAFKNDLLAKIYKKEITQFERFYFVRGSEKYYDLKNSYGIIETSVNLPFNTKEFSESKCFDKQTLPPFFANATQS